MAERPDSNLATGSVGSGGSTAVDVRDWLHQLTSFVAQLVGAGREVLTIASGAITPSKARVLVDTEGAAATDALTTIATTNLPVGSIIKVSSIDASRKVTLKHAASGSGHIFLRDSTDVELAQQSMMVELERSSADRWTEIARWYGSQKDLARADLNLGSLATLNLATISEAKAGASTNTAVSPARFKEGLAHGPLLFDANSTLTSIASGAYQVLVRNITGDGILRLTLDKLRDWILKEDFNSGQLTFAGGKVEVAHSLGSTPSDAGWAIVCVEADGTWAVGDVLKDLSWQTQADNDNGLTLWLSPTAVAFNYQTLRAVPKSGGDPAVLDLARWRLVLKAWK